MSAKAARYSANRFVFCTGMKSAYLRDAAAWAQWMAWMEKKMGKGYGPGFTEWEAAEQLTAYRSRQPLFAGLAYENISATGANAGESGRNLYMFLY